MPSSYDEAFRNIIKNVMILKLVFFSVNSENSLPNHIILNEYEQTFSYIRWYQLEESIVTVNLSPYTLHREMEDFINGNKLEKNY